MTADGVAAEVVTVASRLRGFRCESPTLQTGVISKSLVADPGSRPRSHVTGPRRRSLSVARTGHPGRIKWPAQIAARVFDNHINGGQRRGVQSITKLPT
jgi:hypothetical protein